MRALRLYGPRDVRLEDVNEPEVMNGYVKIKILEVGICGTDKAFYKGTYRPGKLPIILGHEIAGVVVDVGRGVPKDLVGRLVTTEINIPCGKCWFCRHNLKTHCPKREVIGITIDGGMAEYLVTPYSNVHVIEPLKPDEGAFIEPLAAIYEMVLMEPPKPESRVAILGAGTVGLLALQVLRLYAPSLLVVVTRPSSPKAPLARRLGADLVVSSEELDEVLKKYTPEGQGFDYVVEATGSPEGLDVAIRICRPRGTIACKSTHGISTRIDYTLAVVKELRMVGSRCGPFRPAIRAIKEGLVKVKDLISAKLPLNEGARAFEYSLRRDVVKVHLTP